jgi:hypothetical protein
MPSGDLISQQFNNVHSPGMPKPATIASAATITPTARLTFVTGTVQVANVVPPQPDAYCSVCLCFTNAAPGLFLTNGTAYPIKTAYQPIQNRPIELHWDPSSNYWWCAAVV